MGEMLQAGRMYSEVKNICVWNKLSGGMGSLYRSQHELVFVFKTGPARTPTTLNLGYTAVAVPMCGTIPASI